MHLAVAYEFDLNMETLDRQVYSVLDWLGDIGGLSEALLFTGGLVIGFLNYGQFMGFLASSLYKARIKPPLTFSNNGNAYYEPTQKLA